MSRFEIRPVGPYSLAASARFLEGFAPAAYKGGGEDNLRLAFVVDGFVEGGEPVHAFPGPSRLVRLADFPDLSGRKIENLRNLAREAMEGKLDASHLRSLPVEKALEELKKLPGIGDFSAELVLLRGAGEPDLLPGHEPRLRRTVALAYGLNSPPAGEELEKIAGRWRPYRTWVSLYLRTMLEEETGEISRKTRDKPEITFRSELKER